MKYVTSVKHNEASINKLTSVQFNTYNRKSKYAIMGVGVMGLVASVFVGFNTPMGILCLLIGCWAMVSVNYPARSMAKKLCEAYKDDMPWAKYCADEDGLWVTSGNGTWMIEYKDVYSLIEDKENFYVFISPASVHMLPKAALEDGTPEGFKTFLEKKTGKEFGRPGGALRVQKNLFYFIKKAMEKKSEKDGSESGE